MWAKSEIRKSEHDEEVGEALLDGVQVSSALADRIEAEAGDLVYVTDARWWLGGLRATHLKITEVHDDDADWVQMGPTPYGVVVHARRTSKDVFVQRLY